MKDNFQKCYEVILGIEGGLSNDVHDKGGRTFQGITQKEFTHWLAAEGKSDRDVTEMAPEERYAIYHNDYWYPVHGDDLPLGIDLMAYDASVNSGPYVGRVLLQRSLMGPKVDGIIGPKTMAAIKMSDPRLVVVMFGQHYEKFYRSLSDFQYFGHGWLNRNQAVVQVALAMLDLQVATENST